MSEALRERAQRIYEKYGNVMLETAGMTKAGIERKATCRALFSKLLYLAGDKRLRDADSSHHATLLRSPVYVPAEEGTVPARPSQQL